ERLLHAKRRHLYRDGFGSRHLGYGRRVPVRLHAAHRVWLDHREGRRPDQHQSLGQSRRMIRESRAAGSTYAAVEVTPAEGVSLQDRTLTNSSALSTLGPFAKAPYWVRVVRAGNTFSGYSSADGVTWKLIGTATITMASQVFMGMAVCAHNDGVLGSAVFDNVAV